MKIYNTKISEDRIRLLVDNVRKKKELKSFSVTSIKRFLEYELKRNKKALKVLAEIGVDRLEKNKEFVSLVKSIRDVARRIYGVYIGKKYGKRDELLVVGDYDGLLDLHMSTKERFNHYEEIYKVLIEKTMCPKSVLDLACGFNPLAVNYLYDACGKKKKIRYYACDISEEDMDFLNRAFSTGNYNSDSLAFRCDLSDVYSLKVLEQYKTDWCLLFKALDPIEEISENITYDLLDNIKSKYIIVSFPMVTVSRKPMKNPRRNWFEKVLNRKELLFEMVEINDELFYIIENSVKSK